MKRLPIDADTADRLLAGSVAPEDAPPGYAGVAVLLATAAGEQVGDELRREAETVAVVREIVRSSQIEKPSFPRRSFVPRLKLATAFATVALAATTGLAFAGSLPGAAQNVASAVLGTLGVSVPGPNANAGDHPNVRGQSDVTDITVEPSSSGKGSEISDLATGTDLTGVEKGAAISTLASDGQSQAGQHGQAPAEHGTEAATASAEGRTTAEAASDGHSSAGAENAATGQSHRP